MSLVVIKIKIIFYTKATSKLNFFASAKGLFIGVPHKRGAATIGRKK
jgi:hypothetical protein